MISIPVGVKIVKLYEAEMQKVGKGMLYLLSHGILFEKKGEGAKFECNFDSLARYDAIKKNKLRVVIRTPQDNKSVEFKIDMAKLVECDISQAYQEYANSGGLTNSKDSERQEFDQDAHSLSEARWFKENWNDIMRFLKLERAYYLTELVKNLKIGSPNEDPYLLVVDYENLTYEDFTNLPSFLNWRYRDMTDKEVNMITDIFRDFERFSVRTLEMDVKLASESKNYVKYNQSLYERVAIIAREIEFERKTERI